MYLPYSIPRTECDTRWHFKLSRASFGPRFFLFLEWLSCQIQRTPPAPTGLLYPTIPPRARSESLLIFKRVRADFEFRVFLLLDWLSKQSPRNKWIILWTTNINRYDFEYLYYVYNKWADDIAINWRTIVLLPLVIL